MPGELTPVRVDPNTAGPDLWKRFHELRRRRDAELEPDDPPEPDDVAETRIKKQSPYDRAHYFEMSRDGRMISWLEAEHTTPANPEHETNKHLFWSHAYVLPDHRRQGAATAWLPVVNDLMLEFGCTVLGTNVHHESAHGFLKWLGADARLTEIESRLRLSEVDWDLMLSWVEEGQKRSPQTRLEVYDGPLPEEMWAEFAAQRSVLLNTIPFENLDIGNIVVTPERMRFFYERAEAMGEMQHDVLTREPDGVISAMTDVTWAPHRRTLIHQQFTGVLPDARGRGIGKWIKAAMALHVRELYPDAEWIATGNAGSNAPMLKINRAMGFKPYKTHVDYQVAREKLEARISS